MRRDRLHAWLSKDPYPLFGDPTVRLLSLAELLELKLFKYLRDDKRFLLRHLLKSHSALRQQFNTDFPLAEKKGLIASKKLVFEQDGEIVDAETKQQYCDFVDGMIEHIQFDRDGRADAWIVFKNDTEIIVCPEIRGGLPVLRGTRLDTHFLVEQVESNDYNVAYVSQAYEVPIPHVLDAVRYELAQTA